MIALFCGDSDPTHGLSIVDLQYRFEIRNERGTR